MKKKYVFSLYIIGMIIILGGKYIYSQASCEELDFILAPTARWVTLISGIDFIKQADVGYINHTIHFIIAPSCSGVQFLLITFATLFFPFVHRASTVKGGICWLIGSFVFSYPFMVFVNGIRIMLAIYIPVHFGEWIYHANWLSAERLHTIIGVVVYVTALLALYLIASLVSGAKEKTSPRMLSKIVYRFVPPMLCYFSIVLVIPFLHNAGRNDFKQFMEYATLITAVSFAVIFLCCTAYVGWEHLRRKERKP